MGHAAHLASRQAYFGRSDMSPSTTDCRLADAVALGGRGLYIRLCQLQLAAAKKEADEETREEELDRRRKTAASVPAMEAMTREELAPARPRETKEVLDVRSRSSERAGHRGIERSANRGEEQDCGDAGADLEAAVGDVSVRHPIAEEVEEQSEWQRAEPRADERAAGSTSRNVKGDDQAASLASRCRPSRLLPWPPDRVPLQS
jgi:hypothetical protein